MNEKPNTYGNETIEDIISELTELHRQEQILLNRLEYKLKTMKGERNMINKKIADLLLDTYKNELIDRVYRGK